VNDGRELKYRTKKVDFEAATKQVSITMLNNLT